MMPSPLATPVLPNNLMSFLAHTPILPIILVLFLVGYVIVSVILVYHWTEYGMHSGRVILAEMMFIIVSVVLFIISIITLNYF